MSLFRPPDPAYQLFRTLLHCMSHPGRYQTVSGPAQDRPAHGLMLESAVCLLDHEVSFAVLGPQARSLALEIGHRTGSRICDPEAADFVFITGSPSTEAIQQAKRGEQYYPDQGATLLFELSSPGNLSPEDRLTAVRLSGPGIKAPFCPPRMGPDISVYRALREANREYPLGVDSIVLMDNRRVMAIPRSTRIEVN